MAYSVGAITNRLECQASLSLPPPSLYPEIKCVSHASLRTGVGAYHGTPKLWWLEKRVVKDGEVSLIIFPVRASCPEYIWGLLW